MKHEQNDDKNCSNCCAFILFANDVLKDGVVELKLAFTKNFPHMKYISSKAVRLLMQLPIIIMELALSGPGSQRLYVTELKPGIDAQKLVFIVRQFLQSKKAQTKDKLPSKEKLEALCQLASSESDRLIIKMAVCSELSGKEAQKRYGVQNINSKKQKINDAIQRATEIRNVILELANLKEKALLHTLGYDIDSSSDSEDESDLKEVEQVEWISSSEDEIDKDQVNVEQCDMTMLHDRNTSNKLPSDDASQSLDPKSSQKSVSTDISPSRETLVRMLWENNLNWFSFVGELQGMFFFSSKEVVDQILVDMAGYISSSDLSAKEKQLVEVSRQAYLEDLRKLATSDDLFATDSESEDGDWLEIKDILSEEAKVQLQKERKRITRAAKRQTSKKIAQEAILQRKIPKKVSTILTKYPDIGEKMEAFVRKHRVGADQWRRTGVFTFTSNKTTKGPKVTYKRLQEHLQKEYNTTISYGTVVQLCAVRNKRRISAQRYKGVAAITCRRARKGFDVKFNPDSHWSYSFYKGLDILQFKDGTDKLILNRDDQAGFRLDSTYTHKNHKSVCIEGDPEITTHCDYVSKHGGQIQTSSYLFMKTDNTGQVSVGLVKAPGILHDKTPTQHLSDLYSLKEKPEMDSCFQGKRIDCIRVDGGGDEGPGHVEVQFRWTEWHLKEQKELTLVTTRSSGSSCHNLVELQNGVVGRAHANLFIPSTLCGQAETEAGVSQEKLQENMEAALQVYLDRVNNIPFGPTVIKMYRGATDARASKMKDEREDLLVFLRGNKCDKVELKKKKPEMYRYFESIWNLRERHMVKNLPSEYVFALKACYNVKCSHPVCQKGKLPNELAWYSGGPSVQFLPFPVPDPKRCWGSKNCETCSGFCAGHFMGLEQVLSLEARDLLECHTYPPSTVMKNVFNKAEKEKRQLSSVEVEELARKTLLSTEEVKMWITHLSLVKKRRQEGARKAAATRKLKATASKSADQITVPVTADSWCICGGPESGDMIGCDSDYCPIEWFHFDCVGIRGAQWEMDLRRM